MTPASDANREFERQARTDRSGLVSELWGLLRENKKWWLLPILVVLVGMGGLILLSGTAVAPFIYTLF
jgi:Family of unknown function (DUF5989)